MTDLAKILADLLHKRGETLSFAESCTGGRMASALTAIAGASGVFGYGFVTYANAAKTKVLSVPEPLLIEHGAVSAEVAVAMAMGARHVSNSTWALSATGIAGPSGATTSKPVGLVYIGISHSSRNQWRECHFHGSREEIQLAAVEEAFSWLHALLSAPADHS